MISTIIRKMKVFENFNSDLNENENENWVDVSKIVEKDFSDLWKGLLNSFQIVFQWSGQLMKSFPGFQQNNIFHSFDSS
jgi:hypothetical protein